MIFGRGQQLISCKQSIEVSKRQRILNKTGFPPVPSSGRNVYFWNFCSWKPAPPHTVEVVAQAHSRKKSYDKLNSVRGRPLEVHLPLVWINLYCLETSFLFEFLKEYYLFSLTEDSLNMISSLARSSIQRYVHFCILFIFKQWLHF